MVKTCTHALSLLIIKQTDEDCTDMEQDTDE